MMSYMTLLFLFVTHKFYGSISKNLFRCVTEIIKQAKNGEHNSFMSE